MNHERDRKAMNAHESVSKELDASEIDRLRKLLEVEAIKELRLSYNYLMDLRDLDQLINIFTDDALCEYGPYGSWSGKEEILSNNRSVFTGDLKAPFSSFHPNANHRVQLLTDTCAEGQVYLMDFVTHVSEQENPLLWLALYDEEYQKIKGQWKIARTSLQFFWPERHAKSPYS